MTNVAVIFLFTFNAT